MNRKPVNGSKTKELLVRAKRDDADTNSTDSFDMSDFKTSTLNKKYSVPIHKNKADLMAELNNINIMGDESDIEPSIEQASKADTNRSNANIGVGAGVSDRSGSKVTNLSLNTTNSSDVQSNGELSNVKHERILAWAQSQSQNLSMCVASILSDHDYLSQENLVGIITGNEEIETQKLQEIREHSILNNTPKDSQATIFSEKNSNCGEMQENREISPPNEFDDLTAILNKAKTSERSQRQKLYKDLLEKITAKLQINEDESQANDKNADSKAKQTTGRNESNDTPDFSSNHSEPLEHYGGIRFSATTSAEEAKESEGKLKFYYNYSVKRLKINLR